jgi:hypothetical protein
MRLRASRLSSQSSSSSSESEKLGLAGDRLEPARRFLAPLLLLASVGRGEGCGDVDFGDARDDGAERRPFLRDFAPAAEEGAAAEVGGFGVGFGFGATA